MIFMKTAQFRSLSTSFVPSPPVFLKLERCFESGAFQCMSSPVTVKFGAFQCASSPAHLKPSSTTRCESACTLLLLRNVLAMMGASPLVSSAILHGCGPIAGPPLVQRHTRHPGDAPLHPSRLSGGLDDGDDDLDDNLGF
jgi:hypothetical protein